MTDHIGRPLPRREDRALITGTGNYTADHKKTNQTHGVIIRSPYAHARIRAVRTEDAAAMPGVLRVFTAADLQAAGIGPIPSYSRAPGFAVRNADGTDMPEANQYPLATDRVRYVGEPVAFVVAETRDAARDAAEAVDIDYDPLDAVVHPHDALSDGAPALWDDAPGNRSSHWETGDRVGVEAALSVAEHVVEIDVAYPRIVIAFMEPRAALAAFDAETGRYHLLTGCQSAHRMRDMLAEILDTSPANVRVSVPDVGGGFGARTNAYPEFVCALHAARAIGRPVHWVAERSESFLADTQARSQKMSARLGLDRDGNITALSVSSTWWHGGYLAPRSVFILAFWMGPLLGGPYRIPVCHFSCRGVFTNTAPVGSYRGVARAEAMYLTDRLIEEAARSSGLDRAEFRRRNLIPAAALPVETAGGLSLSGMDFHATLDRALDAIGWQAFASRQEQAAQSDRLRGISVTPFVLTAGSGNEEYADLAVDSSGQVTLGVGTQDFGMGHTTVYSQVLADRLGLPADAVRVQQGDTDRIPRGTGSMGSRSMRIGGGAVSAVSDVLIDKALALAEDILETDRRDITFSAPDFVVQGTDRNVSLPEVAAYAEAQGTPLAADTVFTVDGSTYPNGCHACEVEIDPETGRLSIVRFVTIVDPGLAVNPMIVAGQIHGGLAQALGEAFVENCVYDTGSGQMTSGSFMDYALPRADDLPDFDLHIESLAEPDNPLGVKGVGEAGTVGAQATLVNAALDAVASSGVTRLDMPLTPLAIWQALEEANAGN